MDDDRRLLISCLDLTALGAHESDVSLEALCVRATRPLDDDPSVHVAAVCVRPRFVRARDLLAGSNVRVAVATGGFPLPEAPLPERIEEIREAVDAGAEEVDVPVNRFLVDEPDALVGELRATREAAGTATWKAILETGVLRSDEIFVLGQAAVDAGADFLKTATGTAGQGATPAAVEAIARLTAAAISAADRGRHRRPSAWGPPPCWTHCSSEAVTETAQREWFGGNGSGDTIALCPRTRSRGSSCAR
jgi:deoxyribose-phosphate aldolase